MPSFESLRASYRTLWNGMVVNADKSQAAMLAANRVIQGRDRYKAVEKRTSVPWFFIGLCHMREGNFNFGTYLGNGQSINRVTTIVPIARGPFASFEDGAVDALKFQGLVNITDWTLERIAFCLEGFNGFGYRSKGVNTPYLWAGTNRYTSGKYVADHVFDPAAVDKQLGSMAVLSKLCALGCRGRRTGERHAAETAAAS
jgi:lysozyme family protein